MCCKRRKLCGTCDEGRVHILNSMLSYELSWANILDFLLARVNSAEGLKLRGLQAKRGKSDLLGFNDRNLSIIWGYIGLEVSRCMNLLLIEGSEMIFCADEWLRKSCFSLWKWNSCPVIFHDLSKGVLCWTVNFNSFSNIKTWFVRM